MGSNNNREVIDSGCEPTEILTEIIGKIDELQYAQTTPPDIRDRLEYFGDRLLLVLGLLLSQQEDGLTDYSVGFAGSPSGEPVDR